MKLSAALLLLCLTTINCPAQQQPAELIATPNRPTVTNTAETTQFGVLEIEFGIGSAAWQQSLQGLLKFGLLRDVELDWAGNPWQHDASVHYVGVSDNNPGVRWRFLHQAKRQPTLTVEYSAKLPTAGPVEGSGEVDHIVTLLASKDLPKRFHIDANLGYARLGRPGGRFGHDWLPTGALTYSLKERWQLSMEFSGATRANAITPAATQNLWAASYTLRPRLVLDSAVQFRATGNVPRVIYLGGFTYSIADLYHHRH
jgi:Putative MetA-pathway of phenol degradation